MKRLGVFIEHNAMIRHFINSGVLRELSNKYEVHFVFPKGYKSRIWTDVHKLGLKYVHEVKVDLVRISQVRTLARLAKLAVIRKSRGEDKKAQEEYFRWLFRRRGAFIGAMIKSSPIILPYYVRYKRKRLGENRDLEQLILDLEIEVIIHPTVLEGLFVDDLISLGEKHNIPTIYLMNSWDNPSTKAFTLGVPDRLFVWGEQTKQHAVHYLRMPEESIVLSSPAQFEVYRDEPICAPDEYRQKLSIKPHQKLICYGGSSKGLNEMKHLQLLDANIDKYKKDYKILFRPHPWKNIHKDEQHFDEYQFNNVVLDPYSIDNYELLLNGTSYDIHLLDYRYLNVILRSIDGLISPVSTILLEATLFGLPIGAYLSDDDLHGSFHLNLASRRNQWSEFFEMIDLVMCHNEQNLWEMVEKLVVLSEDVSFQKLLKKKATFFVEPTEQRYSTILDEVISDLI